MDRDDWELRRTLRRQGVPPLPLVKPRPATTARPAPQGPEDAPPPQEWIRGLFDETLRRING